MQKDLFLQASLHPNRLKSIAHVSSAVNVPGSVVWQSGCVCKSNIRFIKYTPLTNWHCWPLLAMQVNIRLVCLHWNHPSSKSGFSTSDGFLGSKGLQTLSPCRNSLDCWDQVTPSNIWGGAVPGWEFHGGAFAPSPHTDREREIRSVSRATALIQFNESSSVRNVCSVGFLSQHYNSQMTHLECQVKTPGAEYTTCDLLSLTLYSGVEELKKEQRIQFLSHLQLPHVCQANCEHNNSQCWSPWIAMCKYCLLHVDHTQAGTQGQKGKAVPKQNCSFGECRVLVLSVWCTST